MTDGPGIRVSNGGQRHGWSVRTVAETASTNADLIAAIDGGAAMGRAVLRAEHQTAGRGRLDRRWDAPAGVNLLASLCFADVPAEPAELTQAVGLAAVRALDRVRIASSRIGLKWPNDVLVGDAKLAGVLAQRSTRGPVVVGIGLNVGWAPEGAACVVRDLGVDIEPAALLHLLLVELDEHLALGVDERRAGYVERLDTLGRVVRIQRPIGDDLVGVAIGIDSAGRLLVSRDGDVQVVDAGDIVHLRTPAVDQ